MADTGDCGGVELAKSSFTDLSSDQTIEFPVPDLSGAGFQVPDSDDSKYADINQLDIDALTTGKVHGEGVFDKLMTSVKHHIEEEFRNGRITGEQYTKAYIEITQTALSTATQFLLSKDQAYWQAVIAQAQAQSAEAEVVVARVGVETAKAQLVTSAYQAQTSKGEYALTKMKLATENADFCTKTAQKEQLDYQTENILPAQKALLEEQREVQRAQTMDTRTDGVTIVGSIGKQKDLYSQQITSYTRDAEYKTAKMYLDSWITQKTLDEGLLAPDQLTNANIDEVLAAVRTNNNLGS